MTAYNINQEELTAAIIELNAMSRAEGIIMTKDGHIRTGNRTEEDCLCMLIPAPLLARQLTADGLSSYSAKELKEWADRYDCTPLAHILGLDKSCP